MISISTELITSFNYSIFDGNHMMKLFEMVETTLPEPWSLLHKLKTSVVGITTITLSIDFLYKFMFFLAAPSQEKLGLPI